MVLPETETLRLFAGIAPPAEITSRIAGFVSELRPLARARWSPAANLHITTKFIGAWQRDSVDLVRNALAAVRSGIPPFRIAIRGTGFFPDSRRPRSFYARVEGGEMLPLLAARTDAACANLGIKPDRRYTPHLTLARFPSPAAAAPIQAALAARFSGPLPRDTPPDFGDFEALAFHLYLSQPGPAGAVYSSLAEFPL